MSAGFVKKELNLNISLNKKSTYEESIYDLYSPSFVGFDYSSKAYFMSCFSDVHRSHASEIISKCRKGAKLLDLLNEKKFDMSRFLDIIFSTIDVELVKIMHENCINIRLYDDIIRRTSLTYAKYKSIFETLTVIDNEVYKKIEHLRDADDDSIRSFFEKNVLNLQYIYSLAAEKGLLSIVKYLVSNDKVQFYDTLALRYAAKNGQLSVVKYLCSMNINFQALDDSALKYACLGGHLEVVKFLHQLGIKLHKSNDYDAPIICAAANGHLDVVKYLVRYRSSIKLCNNLAVKLACMNGHLDVVKFLAEKNADIYSNNYEAFKLAANNGHFNVLYFLIERKLKNKITQVLNGDYKNLRPRAIIDMCKILNSNKKNLLYLNKCLKIINNFLCHKIYDTQNFNKNIEKY